MKLRSVVRTSAKIDHGLFFYIVKEEVSASRYYIFCRVAFCISKLVHGSFHEGNLLFSSLLTERNMGRVRGGC